MGIIVFLCNKKNEQNELYYAVGQRGIYLYSIAPDLKEKKIYKFATYYSHEYLVVDNNVYVMYHDVFFDDYYFKYVDVINLETGKITKITAKDLKNNNENITVYYYKYVDNEMKIYYQNLKDKKENEYQGEVFSPFDSHNYVKKDDNTEIEVNNKSIYITGDKEEKIFSLDNEGEKISSIYLVNDNILQIEIISMKYHPYWVTDRYYYYYFDSKKINNSENGFSRIDLTTCIKESLKEYKDNLEEKNFDYSVDVIDQNFSQAKPRAKDLLDNNVDEEKILEIIGIPETKLNEFKKQFINLNDERLKKYSDDKEKTAAAINNHFKVLEHFILKSDSNSITLLSNLVKDLFNNSEYGNLEMAILSGVINYYIEEPITSIKFINTNNDFNDEQSGQYYIELLINDNYALNYSFSNKGELYFHVNIYKDVKDFDEIYNNYDKYENNLNTYLSLSIKSYDYAMNFYELISQLMEKKLNIKK